jgi:hypothetical protein
MKTSTKQVKVTDASGIKVNFDVVLHENDDSSWHGYAVQPPFGIDTNVQDSGASRQDVLDKIRELLTRMARTTPNIQTSHI